MRRAGAQSHDRVLYDQPSWPKVHYVGHRNGEDMDPHHHSNVAWLQTLEHVGRAALHGNPMVPLLAALLVGFLLGLLARAGRDRMRVFQNAGEARLTRALAGRFRAPDYHLLNHLTINLKGGTTQIDHILVSRFGIFVIETKNYAGWIFADPNDRQWTQVLYRAKFRFQNPIRQNYLHVCAIRGLLDFLPADAVRSNVVFTGNAQFKTPIPDGVFTLPGFLAYLDEQANEVLSLNRVQFCVGRLETHRLAITKTTDVEHVQNLRRRYGVYDKEQAEKHGQRRW